MRDAVSNNKPMEDETLDHRTSESMPFVIIIIYDNTWNLKPVSKEEFLSSAFLGRPVRRFLKYSFWTPRKKLSD